MNDEESIRDGVHAAPVFLGRQAIGDRDPTQPPTMAEIDDVLSNAGMTIEEKQARLAAYTGQVDDRSASDRGAEFEPIEMKLRDALSMLADGGHAYGSAKAVDIVPDAADDAQLSGDGSLDRR